MMSIKREIIQEIRYDPRYRLDQLNSFTLNWETRSSIFDILIKASAALYVQIGEEDVKKLVNQINNTILELTRTKDLNQKKTNPNALVLDLPSELRIRIIGNIIIVKCFLLNGNVSTEFKTNLERTIKDLMREMIELNTRLVSSSKSTAAISDSSRGRSSTSAFTNVPGQQTTTNRSSNDKPTGMEVMRINNELSVEYYNPSYGITNAHNHSTTYSALANNNSFPHDQAQSMILNSIDNNASSSSGTTSWTANNSLNTLNSLPSHMNNKDQCEFIVQNIYKFVDDKRFNQNPNDIYSDDGMRIWHLHHHEEKDIMNWLTRNYEEEVGGRSMIPKRQLFQSYLNFFEKSSKRLNNINFGKIVFKTFPHLVSYKTGTHSRGTEIHHYKNLAKKSI